MWMRDLTRAVDRPTQAVVRVVRNSLCHLIERRQRTDQPVRVSSAARFSFYLPAKEQYRGRFFESTYPTLAQENAFDGTIAFAVANGAYVVSPNNGGGVAAAPEFGGYRVNAAAAKFSRVIAARLHGADAPARGYIYGVCSGAYQTIGAAENTDGMWQGPVSIVPGVPNSIPSFMSMQVLAPRVLADDRPAIVDSLEPGGSGDPYEPSTTRRERSSGR
jgi:hypothetical protein